MHSQLADLNNLLLKNIDTLKKLKEPLSTFDGAVKGEKVYDIIEIWPTMEAALSNARQIIRT